MLPWHGNTLIEAVLGLAIAGILCVVLAIAGVLRFLFPLWALFVFVMIFRGFFLSNYVFSSHHEFTGAVWLTVGAFVAFLSSFTVFGRRRHR